VKRAGCLPAEEIITIVHYLKRKPFGIHMKATVQELEVWYILPSIRKELARNMKEKGLSQTKIAKLLGITEAAVSQYLKSKRAVEFKFDDHMKVVLKAAADRIIAGKSQRAEIQKVISQAEKSRVVCKVCGDTKGICKECFV
jgi:uncharacterized protein